MLLVAQAVVAMAAVYLLVLSIAAIVRPAWVKRFLQAHAQTARLHALELVLRCTVGFAFIRAAPSMRGGEVVALAGWILVVTTLVLAVTPWRAHRRFATWSVSKATRSMPLIAIGAFLGSAVIGVALLLGPRGA